MSSKSSHKQPYDGEIRAVKRFAIIPVKIGKTWIWWEYIYEIEQFSSCWADRGWKHLRFSLTDMIT